MLNLVVLVSGGGTNLQAIIDEIEEEKLQNVKIRAVISNNENAYALKRAENYDIPKLYISPKQFDTKEEFADILLEAIESYEADLVVLAGYLLVVPQCIVNKYANRIINIHPSLIPAFCGKGYYGLKVHEEALKRGVKITGATVHFVDEGTDTGPIILQKSVEVSVDDTAKTLQKRVMEEAEWVILPEAIGLIAEDKIIVEDGIVKRK